MPPKARTKKDPGESPTSWREDQRRLRNRLSQKAVRERRAARIQQLEQQLAAVTKGGDSARVTELLNTNSKLRHALLDTRKKLASLSATATQLGERIKLVLDDDDDDDVEQDAGNSVPSQTDMFDHQTYNLWRNNSQTCIQSPPTSSTESISIGQEPDQFPPPDHLAMINPTTTEVEVEATYINHLPDQHDKILDSMDVMFHPGEAHETMSPFFPAPQLGPKVRVFTGSIFSQHLDHIHGLLRLGGALANGTRLAIQPFMFNPLDDLEALMPCSMPQVVEHMVAAFIECAWPSFKDWFDVTQSRPLANRVVWWQTSNSQEAATQVPPGNTPTLIQLSRPKYPCILDWVPHPGMRDRLILDYESYDVDQVIFDMTSSFVVEVEDTRPVFDDAYPGQPLPIVGNGYSCHLMEIVDRSLGFGPMENQTQQELAVLRLLRSIPASSKYDSMDHHPIHRFKLDPRFFDKYPALYDANAESKYRPKSPNLARRSQVAHPFTTETVKEYMNAALRAKSSLVGA